MEIVELLLSVNDGALALPLSNGAARGGDPPSGLPQRLDLSSQVQLVAPRRLIPAAVEQRPGHTHRVLGEMPIDVFEPPHAAHG